MGSPTNPECLLHEATVPSVTSAFMKRHCAINDPRSSPSQPVGNRGSPSPLHPLPLVNLLGTVWVRTALKIKPLVLVQCIICPFLRLTCPHQLLRAREQGQASAVPGGEGVLRSPHTHTHTQQSAASHQRFFRSYSVSHTPTGSTGSTARTQQHLERTALGCRGGTEGTQRRAVSPPPTPTPTGSSTVGPASHVARSPACLRHAM